MHICRLAHVLEKLFEPEARLFAPPATNVSGGRLDCECFNGAAHTVAALLANEHLEVHMNGTGTESRTPLFMPSQEGHAEVATACFNSVKFVLYDFT